MKVIIGYVTEVKNEPGTNTIRFYIPTTIAPRYISSSETDDNAKNIKEMTFSLSSPALLSVKVAVSLQGGIKSIDSPTHNVTVTNSGTIPQNEVWHEAMVELSAPTTEMDRDFVLNIVPEEAHKPRLYSEVKPRITSPLHFKHTHQLTRFSSSTLFFYLYLRKHNS